MGHSMGKHESWDWEARTSYKLEHMPDKGFIWDKLSFDNEPNYDWLTPLLQWIKMPKRTTKRKLPRNHMALDAFEKGEASYGKKKFVVRVRKPAGGVKTVKFGDPNMEIKRDSAKRRKNFRSRHNCKNPVSSYKGEILSCKMWKRRSQSAM